MDPVIHGPELHCVPRRSLDAGGHRVLLRPPSPQVHQVKFRTGAQLQRPGIRLRPRREVGVISTAPPREQTDNQERKEASPQRGGRPPNR